MSSGTPSSPGWPACPASPGPKNSTKQQPGRELLEFCRDRRSDVLRFTDGHQRLADERSGFTLHLLGAFCSVGVFAVVRSCCRSCVEYCVWH